MEVIDCDLDNICFNIPKAELHVHIEGCLEADLMKTIAERNNSLTKDEISKINI